MSNDKTTRRRLSDLYAQSKPISFPANLDGGEGFDELDLVIVKPSMPEMESVKRRADAAKAAVMVAARTPDSELRGSAALIAEELDEQELAAWAIGEKLSELEHTIRARVSAEDEWSKDGYLDSLIESWDTEMRVRFEDDPDDAEAAGILNELDRYRQAVEAEYAVERDEQIEIQASRGRDALTPLVIENLMKIEANEAWMVEARYQQLYFATRQAGAGPVRRLPRYFESVDEIRECPQQIRDRLNDCYTSLVVDSMEGKDSPAPPDS